MPRWPSDWLGLSPEASHTARVAGSHRTNGFGFSNTVELVVARVDLMCQTTYPGFPQERSLNFYPIAIEAIRKKLEVLVD
ncbi:hypothetical protein EBA21_18230 [Xanthomonas oryzae pv. oryzae]|nr:hypothetical protein EBA21_18230 [Xanthomonas oryzae pv. oryzae]RBF80777.1 hypothetical protein BRM95_23265 [Xanthomonas oryzae pv. oryzae]